MNEAQGGDVAGLTMLGLILETKQPESGAKCLGTALLTHGQT